MGLGRWSLGRRRLLLAWLVPQQLGNGGLGRALCPSGGLSEPLPATRALHTATTSIHTGREQLLKQGGGRLWPRMAQHGVAAKRVNARVKDVRELDRLSQARLQQAVAEPEPEPQQAVAPHEQVAERPQRQSWTDDELVQRVKRAVKLEEEGRLNESLQLYEAVYAVYQKACRPRPKLQRRIIDLKRRVAVEEELGMVVQEGASSVDPEASERRVRARRIGEREREQLHAVLRLQANFRGYKARRELAKSRSESAEMFLGDSSVDATSVVDAFKSAARRGRLRTQQEIKYMEQAVSAREQELRAEAARAKRAEAEAERLRTRLEFFQRAQPALAAYMEDEASRAEMSADLTADLGPLSDSWVELSKTAPMHTQFNTLLLQLTGHSAAATAVRISLLREDPESSVGLLQGPIAGTEWSRWFDSAGEYFLLQGHHPSEEDTGGGIFTALYDYPQEGEQEVTSCEDDDAEYRPLRMCANDIVEVVERSDPDWWFGRLRDSGGDQVDSSTTTSHYSDIGLFPAVMVRPYGAQATAPPEVAAALGAHAQRAEVPNSRTIPKIEVMDSAGDQRPPVFGALLDSDHPLMDMVEYGYDAATTHSCTRTHMVHAFVSV